MSRDEFAMLRHAVEDQGRRLGREVGQVSRDLASFRHEHDQQHAADQSARLATRRWLVGTIIAALVALEAPIFFLVAHVR